MVVIPRLCGQGELMDVHTFCLVSKYSMVFKYETPPVYPSPVYPPEGHKLFINHGLSKKRRNIKKWIKDLTTNKYLCIYRRNTTPESSVVHSPSICPLLCWTIEWLHRRLSFWTQLHVARNDTFCCNVDLLMFRSQYLAHQPWDRYEQLHDLQSDICTFALNGI